MLKRYSASFCTALQPHMARAIASWGLDPPLALLPRRAPLRTLNYSRTTLNMPLNRHTRKRATLLTSLSLASLSSAIVLPSPATQDVRVAGASSVRKTLNFGPHIQAAHHSQDSNPSAALRAWNSAAPAISFASGDLVGKDLARAFGECCRSLRSVAETDPCHPQSRRCTLEPTSVWWMASSPSTRTSSMPTSCRLLEGSTLPTVT